MLSEKEAIPHSTNSALIFILFMLGGFFIAQFAGFLTVMPFFEFNLEKVTAFLTDFTNQPSNKLPLLLLQAVYSFVLFIAAPLAYLYLYAQGSLTMFWQVKGKVGLLLLFTFILMMTYMPLSGYLVWWNEQLVFPESLSSLESVFKTWEQDAQRLTLFLVTFENIGQFLGGLLVLAVLPGIGEELLFRGFLQPAIARWTNNIHAGIWLAAIFFSAFHLQFYGFIPRLALGVLFGYLYFFTGRIWIAMFAHFLNNAYSLVLVYAIGGEDLSYGIGGGEGVSFLPALLSLLVVVGLLFYLKKQFLSDEQHIFSRDDDNYSQYHS